VPQGQGITDKVLGKTVAMRKVDVVAGAAGVDEERVAAAAIDFGNVVAQIVAFVDQTPSHRAQACPPVRPDRRPV
jgi:cephalosporin-C deacetylase-like acetyl esterase